MHQLSERKFHSLPHQFAYFRTGDFDLSLPIFPSGISQPQQGFLADESGKEGGEAHSFTVEGFGVSVGGIETRQSFFDPSWARREEIVTVLTSGKIATAVGEVFGHVAQDVDEL